MSKKADTWMPLYVGEYLADTTHLSTEQHGAYCLMLMAAWKRGGALPNDDAQLAAITKLTPAKWKAHKAVLVEFFQLEGATLEHKRVTYERQKAQAISEKKAAAGVDGAAKRWLNDGVEVAEGLANAIAKPIANATLYAIDGGMANAWQTDAPIPLPIPNTSEAKASVSAEPTIPRCPHVALIDLYGKHLPELPQPQPELWNGKRAKAMQARWKWLFTAKKRSGERYATTEAEALAWFDRFFGYVAKSDFLTGRSGRWSNCDLGWLMEQTNFAKVIQGNYENRAAA